MVSYQQTLVLWLGLLCPSQSFLQPHSSIRSSRLSLSDSNHNDNEATNSPFMSNINMNLTPRDARITLPLSTLLTYSTFVQPSFASSVEPPPPRTVGTNGIVSSEGYDAAVTKYFPGALPSSAVTNLVLSNLQKERKFTPSNTLLGASFCSDEIDSFPGSLTVNLKKKFAPKNGYFNLGGLGGLPFVGTSGFGAFFSHCPYDGKILIVFGPHVGVSNEGVVGKVEREGQGGGLSTSCGAAVGAYKAISAAAKNGTKLNTSQAGFDFQEEFIIQKLQARLKLLAEKEAQGSDATVSYVTQQMYEIIYELMNNEVQNAASDAGFFKRVSEVVLLGGIVINRGHGSQLKGGDDYFQPITMKSITKDGESDIFNKVFSSSAGFESSLLTYFPGAVSNSEANKRVTALLTNTRGYDSSNTLFGSSLCSDEIDSSPSSLVNALQNNFAPTGGVFNLGGLGGLPFVGTSGFGAFFSHCPKSGKVLILYGPHVGISNKGMVGKVERLEQDKNISTSCGAAVGAYKAIAAAAKNNIQLNTSQAGFDFQEEFIIKKLQARLSNLAAIEAKGNDEAVAYVTRQMYEIITELMNSEVDKITSKDTFWENVSEVTLLGGVVINRGHGSGFKGGDDFFQPLSMTAISRSGKVDLLPEAFGDAPVPTFSSTSADDSKSVSPLVSGAIGSAAVIGALAARDSSSSAQNVPVRRYQSIPTSTQTIDSLGGTKIIEEVPDGVPILRNWMENPNGTITGFISGSPFYFENDMVTTSPIVGAISGSSVVMTGSGSRYYLEGEGASKLVSSKRKQKVGRR